MMSVELPNVQELLASALHDYFRGSLETAEHLCRQINTTDPDLAGQRSQLLGLILMGRGQFIEAADAYGEALENLPEHPGIRFGLGNALGAQGRHAEALVHLEFAATQAPDQADTHRAIGDILIAMGKTSEAVTRYERAAGLDPDDASIYDKLGLAFFNERQHDAAAASFRRSIELAPEFPAGHYMLGNVLLDQATFAEAGECFERAIALKPDFAEAMTNLGLTFAARKMFDAAEAHIRLAIATKPGLLNAHACLGDIRAENGDLQNAEASYRQILRLDPENAQAHHKLGNLSLRQEKLETAAAHMERAIKLKPDLLAAYVDFGNVRIAQNRLPEAAAFLKQALKMNPDFVEALNNMGMIARRSGKLDDAADCFSRAIAIRPGMASPREGLGSVLYEKGRLDEAEVCFREALAVDPGHAPTRLGLSILMLLKGDYAQGWKDYEYRWQEPRVDRSALPRDLTGHSVLVVGEQGLGDELFFLRFAQPLKARGARIVYQGNPRLTTILSRVSCLDQVVSPGDTLASPDYRVMVGDLPFVTGMSTVADVPRALSLSVTPQAVARASARLAAAGPPPYIGLTWRAGTPLEEQMHIRGRRLLLSKEIPLDKLVSALDGVHATFVSLQRTPGHGEIRALRAALGQSIDDCSGLGDDLEATLALLSRLDDYVGVSNTNMHLLAGLGKPAKVIVPFPPEWRWMAEGDESPWFTGLSIYRCRPDGDWGQALARLAADLHLEFSRGGARPARAKFP